MFPAGIFFWTQEPICWGEETANVCREVIVMSFMPQLANLGLCFDSWLRISHFQRFHKLFWWIFCALFFLMKIIIRFNISLIAFWCWASTVEEVLKILTYFVDVEEVLKKAPTIMSVKFRCLHVALREGLKNPSHGICPSGGYPPPSIALYYISLLSGLGNMMIKTEIQIWITEII